MNEIKLEHQVTQSSSYSFSKQNNYTMMVTFDSIHEFVEYVQSQPTSEGWKYGSHASNKTETKGWSNVQNRKEAADLALQGWDAGIKEINKRVDDLKGQNELLEKSLPFNAVCGYHPIVPLYLNGIPTNMVNKKFVKQKQKVITINKLIGAACGTSAQTIMDEAIKCIQIIKKIEASGVRTNLNIVMSPGADVLVLLKIKSASEPLNLSKIAFPLCHPAMDRRLFFRFCEVYPQMPEKYNYGYGSAPYYKDIMKILPDNEVVIPATTYMADVLSLSVEDLIKRFQKKDK